MVIFVIEMEIDGKAGVVPDRDMLVDITETMQYRGRYIGIGHHTALRMIVRSPAAEHSQIQFAFGIPGILFRNLSRHNS